MVAPKQDLQPIVCQAGIDKENTPLRALSYVDGKNIRFVDGEPRKIGGSIDYEFADGTISGCCRMLYGQSFDSRANYLYGTHSYLFHSVNTALTNITPLQTSTNAIANSLDTNYSSLATNPLTTVNASDTVTVALTGAGSLLEVGDVITLSGSGAVNGIPNTDINKIHIVRSVATNSFTIVTATAATSSGTGGGGSVVFTCAIVTVNATAHGQANGDRVKITGAATTGGIPNTEINAEHIIRGVTTNTFDIVLTTAATSSVSGGGGASTVYQKQIAAGQCDASAGVGYSAGLYSDGIYSSALSGTSVVQPRIWSAGAFGDFVIMTPGQGGVVYTWDFDTDVAPVALTNAPTADYVFTFNNIVYTLLGNRVKNSDRGNETVWTPSRANYAREDNLEGCDDLITHAEINGSVLLFSNTQTWLMTYLGLDLVNDFERVSGGLGCISQNARVVVNNQVFVMTTNNFQTYNAPNMQAVPCSIQNFVFDNINRTQQAKCFAFYRHRYNEVCFAYPDTTSDEPNMLAILNLNDGTWTIGEYTRSAHEYPLQLEQFPRMITPNGVVRQHERGVNDGDSSLPWSLTTKWFSPSRSTIELGGFMPDMEAVGNITYTIEVKDYPQDTDIVTYTETITNATKLVAHSFAGRVFRYKLEQDEVDGNYKQGVNRQYISGGTREGVIR